MFWSDWYQFFRIRLLYKKNSLDNLNLTFSVADPNDFWPDPDPSERSGSGIGSGFGSGSGFEFLWKNNSFENLKYISWFLGFYRFIPCQVASLSCFHAIFYVNLLHFILNLSCWVRIRTRWPDLDPDPAKRSGSYRIRIRNTAYQIIGSDLSGYKN